VLIVEHLRAPCRVAYLLDDQHERRPVHNSTRLPELLALDRRMQVLARTRGGVVSQVDCRALDVDAGAIRALIRSGLWCRDRRGIYRDTRLVLTRGTDVAHHRRCAALLAALAGPAVVSHVSAVRLLRLPLPPGRGEPRACITRRPPAPSNDPLLGDVHVSGYDDADVRIVGGPPVLAGARLVLDCCAVLPPDSALAIADAALQRHLTTRQRLAHELERRRGRNGTPVAAVVLERADPLAANWFESMSRWWLLEAGLPRPELQVGFADDHGQVPAVVDMWFRGQRTVGEADGAGKYDEPGALFAEKRREDWPRDTHEVEVVRWVPAEMRTPQGRHEVAARFHRAFARRC
jgi:hypothetical protein